VDEALSILCLGLIAFGTTGLAIQVSIFARRFFLKHWPPTPHGTPRCDVDTSAASASSPAVDSDEREQPSWPHTTSDFLSHTPTIAADEAAHEVSR